MTFTNTHEEKHQIKNHILDDLATDIDRLAPIHPFAEKIDMLHMEPLLANYLAMSMSFPYLQSGSCSDAIISSIKNGREMPAHFEKSSIVGAFLVWDELGGWHKTFKKGHAGLPNILDSKAVHANYLKADLEILFGHKVEMRFDKPTKEYLLEFYQALSSEIPIIRCAAMVTFELHAERMITSLWETVAQSFPVEKHRLKYFDSHVGGDDPAEAYHVQMTKNLVDAVVEPNKIERFKAEALRLYFLHIQWCKNICTL
jgi:hypothetical protein